MDYESANHKDSLRERVGEILAEELGEEEGATERLVDLVTDEVWDWLTGQDFWKAGDAEDDE